MLEAHSGDLSYLSMKANLKLCELELLLQPYVYDSFKRLNQMLPKILENGPKECQLEAHLLMGKILIKMGSLNLEPNHASQASMMQEESKIADEQDWQH